MNIFVGTLAILVLVVLAQSSTRSLTSRFSLGMLWILGSSISLGIAAGWTSLQITGSTIRIFTAVLTLICLVKIFQKSKNKTSKFHKRNLSTEFFQVFFIPAVFLFYISALMVQEKTHYFSFLLNTWDGSSNSGMVSALREFRQVSSFPEFKGIETYPLGTHYLASWLPDLVHLEEYLEPIKTVASFAVLQFLLYTLLMIQSARLAVLFCNLHQIGEAQKIIAAWCSQSIFLTPFLIENLLFMHSLAFLGALVVSFGTLLEIFENQMSSPTEIARIINLLGLGILMTVTSYPLLLPIQVFMLIGVIGSHRNRIKIFLSSSDLRTMLRLTPFLSSTSLAVVQLLSTFLLTTPSSRFGLGGHLIAIDIRWLLLITVFALLMVAVSLSRQTEKRLVLVLTVISVLFVVGYSWLNSSSFDRTYGLNYYAKKSEYILLVIFIPMAITGALYLLGILSKRILTTTFPRATGLVVLGISTMPIVYGVHISFYTTVINNAPRNLLMSSALQQGALQGKSIIWYNAVPDLSRNATLMSNYIDQLGYRTPDSSDTTLILAQQLQIRNPLEEVSEFCEILSPVDGRIVDVSSSIVYDCSDPHNN